MAKPVIHKERCAAQPQICPPLKACPVRAIAYQEDDDEPLLALPLIGECEARQVQHEGQGRGADPGGFEELAALHFDSAALEGGMAV